MNSATVLHLLREHKTELKDKFGVNSLGLFGSVSRNQATELSDIDILVDFEGPATSARYYGLQFFLEDTFQCSIDLVTSQALRAELKPFIEKDLIRV